MEMSHYLNVNISFPLMSLLKSCRDFCSFFLILPFNIFNSCLGWLKVIQVVDTKRPVVQAEEEGLPAVRPQSEGGGEGEAAGRCGPAAVVRDPRHSRHQKLEQHLRGQAVRAGRGGGRVAVSVITS